MARRRSNFSFARGGRSVRRSTSWELFNFGFVNGIVADGSLVFPSGFVPQEEGLTLVRLRGELVLSSTGTSGDSAELAVGIGVVSAEAFAVGVTALSSPITDAFWPGWMYHQWCSVNMVAQSPNTQFQNYRFEVDNKSMRKLQVGNVLMAVMEMDNEQGTGVTADVFLNCRGLLKLA